MNADTYTLARIQRLELTIAIREGRIRDLENRLLIAEARLAAVDQIHGVPA